MKNKRMGLLAGMLVGALCLSGLVSGPRTQAAVGRAPAPGDQRGAIGHVLLLSVDGLHAVDLARYVRLNPTSAMARLTTTGVTYPNASASQPSDSFPGLLAAVTGGTPRSTGVYYDNSYDRSLYAPGSGCAGTPGTEVVYDESIDKNPNALDGGGDSSVGSIDPGKLPLALANGHCTPVYPHSFLRVNTIFEVVRAAGKRTAWSDKHPAYDLVNGPSGQGVADLYTPEIAANGTTNSISATEAYDDLKVTALLNQIAGKTSTGTRLVGVPALFGMNFQAVSVGQKLVQKVDATTIITNGYTDSQATPSAGLQDALAHTDHSIGVLMDALSARGLLSSTLIIVTAKHGQAPIDPHRLKKIAPALLESAAGGPAVLAKATEDDVALLWLKNHTDTGTVVTSLESQEEALQISKILAGDELTLRFNDPAVDPRTPDVIVLPNLGVIYTGSSKKDAEHGGFSSDDTNVALVVSNPRLRAGQVASPVETTQIAPTILRALGLNPRALQAVREEGTRALPGLTGRGGADAGTKHTDDTGEGATGL